MDAFVKPIEVTAELRGSHLEGRHPAQDHRQVRGRLQRHQGRTSTSASTRSTRSSPTPACSRKAAVEGKLATRADASKHQGDFRKTIEGVNHTLDAVIGPLNVAAKYVDLISKGQIPPRITDSYNGDFNTLKDNLNTCIEAVNALIADTGALATAAVEGKLAARADASKHQGDYRKVIQGVNDAIDAIVVPFRVVAEYCERISHGRHAAPPDQRREWRHRGHAGEPQPVHRRRQRARRRRRSRCRRRPWRGSSPCAPTRRSTRATSASALEGVNATLDAVMGPINEAAQVLEKLAQRDLTARVKGSYQGDHAKIKDALNATAEALHEAMAQVAEAVDAGVVGGRADRLVERGGGRRRLGAGELAGGDELVAASRWRA